MLVVSLTKSFLSFWCKTMVKMEKITQSVKSYLNFEQTLVLQPCLKSFTRQFQPTNQTAETNFSLHDCSVSVSAPRA